MTRNLLKQLESRSERPIPLEDTVSDVFAKDTVAAHESAIGTKMG